MALEIVDVADVLRAHLTDPAQLNAVLKDLIATEKAAKAAEANDDKEPRPKQEFVVLIRGNAATKAAVAGGAWLVKTPAESDNTTLLDRIRSAVQAHNDSLRGKQRGTRIIRTFARAFNLLRPKSILLAEANFKISTKTPVEVMVIESENVQPQPDHVNQA